jgi:hypothetical protein
MVKLSMKGVIEGLSEEIWNWIRSSLTIYCQDNTSSEQTSSSSSAAVPTTRPEPYNFGHFLFEKSRSFPIYHIDRFGNPIKLPDLHENEFKRNPFMGTDLETKMSKIEKENYDEIQKNYHDFIEKRDGVEGWVPAIPGEYNADYWIKNNKGMRVIYAKKPQAWTIQDEHSYIRAKIERMALYNFIVERCKDEGITWTKFEHSSNNNKNNS